MPRRRKAGLDPSSLDTIVKKTDSIQEILRDARNLPIDQIHPNPAQPRQTYDPTAYAQLKASIHELGVLVPILVRPNNDGYQIICGERRYRASRELGLTTIPSVVRKVDDLSALRIAYEENVQREDLTLLDEARFFQGLLDRGQVSSRQDLAQTLKISKGRVSQKLAVLSLSPVLQEAFSRHAFLGELHARVLRRLSDDDKRQKALARIITRQLSGRQAETLVARSLSRESGTSPRTSSVNFQDAALRRTRRGYALRLPALSAPELSQLLSRLARAIKDGEVSLPEDKTLS